MIRLLIADDEAAARKRLRDLAAREADCEVVGECVDGSDALRRITQLVPDVVFLDVSMPRLDGFAVLDRLEEEGVPDPPVLIFVTAFDEHALRAFEARALDYLLKPFSDDRFRASLERARVRLSERRSHTFQQKIRGLIGDVAPVRRPDEFEGRAARFAVQRGASVIVVAADDIVWVEAAGDYVRLHMPERTHLLRSTMGAMLEKLDERFVRIHRSTIVRSDQVRALHSATHGDYRVELHDGTMLRMSRRYRSGLEAWLDR